MAKITTPCGRCSGHHDVRLYIVTAPRSKDTKAEMICCRCLPNMIGDGFTIIRSLDRPRTGIALDFNGGQYLEGWGKAYRLLCASVLPKKEQIDPTIADMVGKGFNDCMEFHFPASAK